MPAIRPEDISNLIRLTYEARAAAARLVPEDRAVDTVLPAIVFEYSPDEEGISCSGSEHDFLPGPDKLVFVTSSSVCVSIS
jgi:hypothetical protein